MPQTIQATNNFVLVIRDKTENEKYGLSLPSAGKEKPHKGTVHSIGSLVKDQKIKSSKGKSILFHKGNGFEMDYEGTTYLVLEDRQIIAVV